MKVMYLMILWFVMFVSAYANIDDTAITLIDNICISTYDNFDKIILDDCVFLTDFGKP